MLVVATLLLLCAPASAGLYHPGPPLASFGPLGGSCAEGDLATGSGDAVIAAGTGNLTKGSTEVTGVIAAEGSFEVGMSVESGFAVRETTIAAVEESSPGVFKLTLSNAATASASGAQLAAGFFDNVTTSCGSFAVGQEIFAAALSGSDQHRADILAVAPGTLTPAHPPRESATTIALTAQSEFHDTPEQLAFDQAASRLYATRGESLKGEGSSLEGFDLSTPGSYSPLAAPFPLPLTKEALPRYVAVDNSGGPHHGDIYADSSQGGELFCYQPGGALCPGFPISPEAEGGGSREWGPLAVDPSGDLWVTLESGHRELLEFSPAGGKIGQFDLTNSPALGGVAIRALAFDSSGHLYVGSNNGAWRLTLPGLEAPLRIDNVPVSQLAVDRATGDLYVADRGPRIERYDAAGEAVESFPAASLQFSIGPNGGRELSGVEGIALDEATKTLYVAAVTTSHLAGNAFQRIYVFQALTLPDLATAPLTNLGETSATLNGSVHPDGVALTGCEFEWVSEAAYLQSGFEDLSSGGEAECEPAFGSISTAGTTTVSAAISGLAPEGRYRFRLSAANANGENHSKPVAFALAKPGAETLACPIRTETTARLDSRIDPHGIATEYSFQYLSEAQFEADGESFGAGTQTTPSRSAGSGGLISLASAEVTELAPASTYRYRVVADNGAFGGAAYGEAFKLTTRSAAEESPSHAPYPGPPGSDRAWEQVNLPDTSGNPALGVQGIAADGDSAVYQVSGGTPASEAGTLYDFLFARRPPDGSDGHPDEGWRTESLLPPRKDAVFSAWLPLAGAPDLSAVLGLNRNLEGSSGTGIWRLHPGGHPEQLYQAPLGAYTGPYLFSEDGSRALLGMQGSRLDPDHASPEGVVQLYDVSSGAAAHGEPPARRRPRRRRPRMRPRDWPKCPRSERRTELPRRLLGLGERALRLLPIRRQRPLQHPPPLPARLRNRTDPPRRRPAALGPRLPRCDDPLHSFRRLPLDPVAPRPRRHHDLRRLQPRRIGGGRRRLPLRHRQP